MKSRLDDLKQRKSQKQELYDEVLKKYGKNSNVQKVLLSTFKTPHSSLSLADIEQKIHKFESKTPNFHSLSEPSCRIKSVESNQKSLKYPEVSNKFNKTCIKKSQTSSIKLVSLIENLMKKKLGQR
jgi:hypothetical protein